MNAGYRGRSGPGGSPSPTELTVLTRHSTVIISFIHLFIFNSAETTRWPSKLTGDGAEETDGPADESRQCCRGESGVG